MAIDDITKTINTLKRINKQLTATGTTLIAQERLITPDQRQELATLLDNITSQTAGDLHGVDPDKYRDFLGRASRAYPANDND